jgi:enamine deaminase RidA (YjgF/YER057c/UK114 family)
MGEVKRIDGNRPWAAIVGYSRAVKIGNLIEVAGTSATTRDGKVMFPNDAYGQTRYILEEIQKVVEELGATYKDVIRTRVYLTNIDDWPGVAKAHGEFFADILPTSSFLEISRLMLPELCSEVEMTLYLQD